MGSVIGKGGAKIKEIQEASGARLQASEAMLPGSTEVRFLHSGYRCTCTDSSLLFAARFVSVWGCRRYSHCRVLCRHDLTGAPSHRGQQHCIPADGWSALRLRASTTCLCAQSASAHGSSRSPWPSHARTRRSDPADLYPERTCR